jgi:selenocysteine-specific elongation factor
MIIGTAGHIDHGKTTLVKALTGVDTDRLKEEKERGISIELGYAYQPLADGGVLGFIDVPGHERFVHTMLAGASGIDHALLVIAADDGVMPQTVEHLDILALLGVRSGTVAITKADRVEPARIAEVEAAIGQLLETTTLAGSPCFAVVGPTGAGIPALRQHLHDIAAEWREPACSEHFRLAVDRSFTLPGIGTVATGTVFAGEVRVGDELVVTPTGLPVRIRSLHAQNRPAAMGTRGQRCALALAGVGREDLHRGDWLVAPLLHQPTDRFDIDLTLLGREARALVDRTPVHVHVGAAHRTGRVALLGGDRLQPGGCMPAQVMVDAPLHCAAGDICILRDISATRTLGGGPVLDVHAPKRHRRRPERLQALSALARPDHGEALEGLLAVTTAGVDLAAFARDRNCRVDDLAKPASAIEAAGRLFTEVAWHALQERILASLQQFHEHNADELGPQAGRLRRMAVPELADAVADGLVASLIADGRVVRSGPWLHLAGHAAALSAADEAAAVAVRGQLADLTEPVWVRDLAAHLGRDEGALRTLMLRLMKRGELLQIVRDLYVTPALASRYARLVADLERAEGEVPAARFRDVTGLGRKRAIQVLEFLDRVGYTRRTGDTHRLRSGASPAMFDVPS